MESLSRPDVCSLIEPVIRTSLELKPIPFPHFPRQSPFPWQPFNLDGVSQETEDGPCPQEQGESAEQVLAELDPFRRLCWRGQPATC